mgnify:CR=1 FL=1
MDFVDQLSESDVAERIAPYGDTGRGVRTSRPKSESGLVQWIWRWARFHNGEDTHIPVTAEFWLKDWLEDEGILPEFTGSNGTERRKIVSEATSELDEFVGRMLRSEFNQSDLEGARRWANAGLA